MTSRQCTVRLLLAIAFLSPAPVFAQSRPVQAFVVFGGPGAARYEGTDGTFNVGIGSEFGWPHGLGLGADFTVATSRYHRIALLSPGIAYTFRSGQTLSPYVRGGYTLAMADGIANMIHLAAGLDQALGRRFGVRYDIRDYSYPDVHLTEFTVGLVIRSTQTP
jgi:hypothetical protein